MKNLKIRVKLIVSFGIVLFMVVILGGVSLVSISKVNGIVNLYATKTVPNTEYIWEIRRNMVSVERYLTEAIASSSREKTLELLDEATSEGKLLTDAIERYKSNSRTDPILMEAYEKQLVVAASYRKQITEILDLPVTDENDAKALQIFEEQYVPAFDKASEELIKVADAVSELADKQQTDAQRTGNLAKNLILFGTLFIIVVTVLVVISVRQAIVKPVGEIERAAKNMAQGRLDSNITYESKDELGSLAQSMRESMGTIRRYIADIDRAMGEMAKGNLDIAPSQPFIGDFKNIEDSITKMIVEISGTLSQINVAADQVSTGSDQVSSGSQALAQGTTEQASSVEELSSTVTEILGHVKQNAQNSKKASDMASETTISIQGCNEKMQNLMLSMSDIEAKSHEISKIIKTIEDIAFQTNILALNAAVEAARAGSAGKGFAVVADEVRNLAAKSADAAKSTTSLIENSVTAIMEGVRLADATAEELSKAVENVVITTDVISQITKASEEQSTSISQVTLGIDQISSVVQTNSATSEESAAASEQLSSQANMLKELIARFRLKDVSSTIGTSTFMSDNGRGSSHSSTVAYNKDPYGKY